MKVLFLNQNSDFNLEAELPWNEKELTDDLQLDILFNAMSQGDEFLFDVAKQNNGNALFLRAERQADTSRTFKLIPGEPLQSSYGVDLYNRIFG